MAVVRWVDVGPAGEHESGEGLESPCAVVRIGEGWRQDDGPSAGAVERVGVAARQRQRPGHPRADPSRFEMASGDRDERFSR